MTATYSRLPVGTMHVRRSRGVGLTLFILVMSGMFAVIARATAPKPFALALAVMLLTMFAWAVKPIVGMCLSVMLALIADGATEVWYPWVKGLSAQESIMFVNNSLILSPHEIVLVFAVMALVGRWLVLGRWELSFGRLPLAVCALMVFVVFGLGYGYIQGGDRQIALTEIRPFVAFLLTYILVSSVCRKLSDYRYLLWAIVGAIAVHGLVSLQHLSGLSSDALKQSESIVDHGAAMRIDILILLTIGLWLFARRAPKARLMRWTCTLLLLPVGWVYLTAQRRAAVVGLVAAMALMSIVLFWHRRRLFMKVVPIAALLLAAYTGAFWSSTSTAAFPAQAVKSVIAPTDVSDRNQSSDLYRVIENLDLHYTIQTARITGIGFGKPFYRPFPLPALSSSFELALYIPHNSFLWVWMTMGFGGFVAMIYMLGRCISVGAAKLRTWTDGTELVVILTFVLAVVVFTVFSFVDIAWDASNLTMLGAAVAVCANYPAQRRRSDGEPGVDLEGAAEPYDGPVLVGGAMRP